MEDQRGTAGWASGTSGTDEPVPAHVVRVPVARPDWNRGPAVPGTEGQWYAGDGTVPAARVPLNLGGAVQVERVLAQPEVVAVREAILAYGPAGLYQYDLSLTCVSPWGDTDVFHVIKVWYRPEPDGRVYSASGRVIGEPVPSAVAVTVRGILISLERIKAIQEDRDTYSARTSHPAGDEPPPGRKSRVRHSRPIKDNPQA